MRNFNLFSLFIVFTLLLTGCTEEEKGETSSNKKLVIEPYDLSEKEQSLISKTDVENIQFFVLNGNLKENEDLKFSVEVYEKGNFKEEILESSSGNQQFNDDFISFGIGSNRLTDNSLKIINGIPSGLTTTLYTNKMKANTFNKLINDKVTLEKNHPLYLAVWLGNSNGPISSGPEESGKLPKDIEQTELAFVYKILWTDKENSK